MQVASRRNAPATMHNLYIIKRQMTPRCRLWMFALIEPGDSSGTFIYSDKGNVVEPFKHHRTHPNFDRLQSLHDPHRRLISIDLVTQIPQSEMHCPRGFYESISVSELDLLPNTDWILAALYMLEKNNIVPDNTWLRWSTRLAPEHCATTPSSTDSMRVFGSSQPSSPPPVDPSPRIPTTYEAALAGLNQDLDTAFLGFERDKAHHAVQAGSARLQPDLSQQHPDRRARARNRLLQGVGAVGASPPPSLKDKDIAVRGRIRQRPAASLVEPARPLRRRRLWNTNETFR